MAEAGIEDSTRYFLGGWKQMKRMDSVYLRKINNLPFLKSAMDKLNLGFLGY